MAITTTGSTTGRTANNLQVSSLDFVGIKTNLINFLKKQPEFTDYDFTGSSLNVLIDLLAYTTHYLGVYTNMSFNEMFLDTAKLRNSVVSKAKELGYVPRQSQGALATVHITSNDVATLTNPPSTLVIGKHTRFISSKLNTSYDFVSISDTPANMVNYVDVNGNRQSRWEADLSLVQGTQVRHQFVVVDPAIDRFILPSIGVDVRYLVVNVTQSNGTTVEFVQATTLSGISSTSSVFFLQETNDRFVEIYFGDGTFGVAIQANDTIDVDYIVTQGVQGNGCRVFDMTSASVGTTVSNASALTISLADFKPTTTIDRASGGAAAETIDSIRVNAPLSHKAQSRAVTIDDYTALLTSQYGFIAAVNVWGGETNIPAEFGTVFISIRPNDTSLVSTVRKNQILADFTARYSMVGITPKIVDAEYVYVVINTTISFSKTKTTKNSTEIESQAESVILEYFNTSLISFSSSMSYSKLLHIIDTSDASVIGNLTSVQIAYALYENNSLGAYTLNFNNALTAGTLMSDTWQVGNFVYQLRDNGAGSLILYENSAIKTTAAAGAINYATGIINLTRFYSGMPANNAIIFRATPASNDINSVRQSITAINPSIIPNSLIVTAVPV